MNSKGERGEPWHTPQIISFSFSLLISREGAKGSYLFETGLFRGASMLRFLRVPILLRRVPVL